jgi:hypothetical protein
LAAAHGIDNNLRGNMDAPSLTMLSFLPLPVGNVFPIIRVVSPDRFCLLFPYVDQCFMLNRPDLLTLLAFWFYQFIQRADATATEWLPKQFLPI